MRNGRFGAGGSRNRSAGHIGCRDTLDGRLLRRADPSADLRPHDPALRAGGDFQQDHARYFPFGHPLRRSGLGRPFGRQSRRHGERIEGQGRPARLLAREQPLGHHRGRGLLHLQRQICRRACEAIGRNDRLPARRRGGEPPQQRAGDLHGGAGQRIAAAGEAHYEVDLQERPPRGKAYRLQAFRHPVSTQRHLLAQRAALFPPATEEFLERAFRGRSPHLQDRG